MASCKRLYSDVLFVAPMSPSDVQSPNLRPQGHPPDHCGFLFEFVLKIFCLLLLWKPFGRLRPKYEAAGASTRSLWFLVNVSTPNTECLLLWSPSAVQGPNLRPLGSPQDHGGFLSALCSEFVLCCSAAALRPSAASICFYAETLIPERAHTKLLTQHRRDERTDP